MKVAPHFCFTINKHSRGNAVGIVFIMTQQSSPSTQSENNIHTLVYFSKIACIFFFIASLISFIPALTDNSSSTIIICRQVFLAVLNLCFLVFFVLLLLISGQGTKLRTFAYVGIIIELIISLINLYSIANIIAFYRTNEPLLQISRGMVIIIDSLDLVLGIVFLLLSKYFKKYKPLYYSTIFVGIAYFIFFFTTIFAPNFLHLSLSNPFAFRVIMNINIPLLFLSAAVFFLLFARTFNKK